MALRKSAVESGCSCRILVAEVIALAEGGLTGLDIARRWLVEPDWAGRPSLTPEDATTALAACREAAELDWNRRRGWDRYMDERPRQRARFVAEAVAEVRRKHSAPRGLLGLFPIADLQQLVEEAAERAGETFDRANPESFEWFVETQG